MKFKSKFEAGWCTWDQTYDYHTGIWRYSRPVLNESKCRQCGWCYLFCPTNSMVKKHGYFQPDLDYCKGCGVCKQVCPADAIIMIAEKDREDGQ